MRRLWLIAFLFLCAASFTLARAVFATDQSSTNYKNNDSSFAPTVFKVTSGSYLLDASVEPIVGQSSSVSFKVLHGVYLKEIVTPTPPPPPPPPPPAGGGGGGGGGGGPLLPPSGFASSTSVTLVGRAYPLSKVVVLKDGQIAITTIAGPDAKFNVTINGLTAGTFAFTVYGEDSKGRHSHLFSFSVQVTAGANTTISGIFISPTVDVYKAVVQQGEPQTVLGQTTPNGDVSIVIHSAQTITAKVKSDDNGAYAYNFDTRPLDIGMHSANSQAALTATNEISQQSLSADFEVSLLGGTQSGQKCKRADMNCDGKVNLVDFSIAAFWYKRPLSPAFAAIEHDRLNGDGKLDLVDFSIMAFYWTG